MTDAATAVPVPTGNMFDPDLIKPKGSQVNGDSTDGFPRAQPKADKHEPELLPDE